jgi:hypothetical protein
MDVILDFFSWFWYLKTSLILLFLVPSLASAEHKPIAQRKAFTITVLKQRYLRMKRSSGIHDLETM